MRSRYWHRWIGPVKLPTARFTLQRNATSHEAQSTLTFGYEVANIRFYATVHLRRGRYTCGPPTNEKRTGKRDRP